MAAADPASITNVNFPLEWHLRAGRDSYRRGPHSNKKWDAAADRALEQFALMRVSAPESNAFWQTLVASNCTEAIKAGCTDPLITFLSLHQQAAKDRFSESTAMELANATVRLKSSSYPAALKLESTLIALQSIFSTVAAEPPRRLIKELGSPLDYLEPIFEDPELPVAEAYRLSDMILQFCEGTTNASKYRNIHDQVQTRMERRWPGDHRTWLLKGEAHTCLAWIHRGSGTADTVTEAGSQAFRANLDIAHEALERAWRLNSSDIKIPLKMITVAVGKGCGGPGRDLMELWFERAMKIDPNCVQACRAKMYYLEPKWHGCRSFQLDFGRQCVESTNWGGRVPLVLIETHQEIADNQESEQDKLEYWKSDPGIWLDIEEAFEKFFELNPMETRFYARYLLYAARAERWDKVKEILPKVTPSHYDSIAGESEYKRIASLAALRSPKTSKIRMNLWVETNRMHDRFINRIDFFWTNDHEMRRQIAEYEDLLKKYPNASADEKGNLLLKQAFVYEQPLRDVNGGRQVYQRILREVPRSSAAPIARRALQKPSSKPLHSH